MIEEHDEHDETIERIADALRPLPEVDSSAKARVLVAVAAERAKERTPMVSGGWRGWRGARWGGAIAGLAAAAAVATFTLHGTRRAPDHAAPMTPAATTPPTSSGGRPTSPSTSTLAASTDAAALQPVQLVLHAATAHHVSVVGDFTEWDERRAAMTRDAESGLWSITLALRPGRHVYAFLVDDSIWVRDPRAPVAADADFGRPGSVLLVGRP